MKKIIVFLGICFILVTSYYLFNWAKSGLFVKEQEKRDIIEQILQEQVIMTTVKNDTRVELSQFGTKIINSANAKQRELCSKQIMNLLTRKKDCSLEEFNIDNLSQISLIYENGLSQVVGIQAEVEKRTL